jgi:hypothetical protein
MISSLPPPPSGSNYWNAESVGHAYRQQIDPRYTKVLEPTVASTTAAAAAASNVGNTAMYYLQGVRQ